MVFYYQQAMFKKGVWPLEEHFSKTSVGAILTRLKTIGWSEQSSWGCKQCTFDCAKVIDGAVERTKKYFDGLCLDYMQDDAPSNEYGWKEKETWHCKGGRHGEPTRYYSQMWANSRERYNIFDLNLCVSEGLHFYMGVLASLESQLPAPLVLGSTDNINGSLTACFSVSTR
ncbi:hypothetical protein BGW36DRAFT_453231 [Talaromyces proteolyticus]|uniref:Uncharacterized protein n=1 Tax=Talaromyces proteolyticus TaxID=1131652 RepID=A0AAD4PYM7_9EURO|nr:uncharacterized protein BGW36DRAFT_453231 [Talaromyces proteolyticus]KAH8695323.1 hypothetical protein BGW36DRAFT_453231 [Talaromyces proteolyticus]